MNFSKKGTENKQKQIKSTAKKLATKTSISFFRTFLICILILIIAGAFCAYGLFKGLIDSAPSINPLDVIPSEFSTTIYDENGKEITKLAGSQANRAYATIEEIPKVVQDAFISIEDERFWEHNGIDVKGIFRAFYIGITSGGEFSEGASTLTQQLLKNSVFEGGNENNFIAKLERKLQEQYLAIQLEDKLTKEQILEYYLNTINLGQNTLGVRVAAKRYFNKDISKLNLSEATVIAGITQNPTGYNPITNPKENAKKRKTILNYMLEQGLITEAQKQEALEDDVYSRIQSVNESISGTSIYSYFLDETINQVVKDLQEQKGYSQTQAYNAIYRSGLSIYITQNSKYQKIADDVFADESMYPINSKWELSYRLSIQREDETIDNYAEGHLRNYFIEKNNSFSLLFNTKEDAEPYIEEFKQSVSKAGDTITGEKVTMTIQPQASFVLMEQTTGKVLAIVGGRGSKEINLALNRASMTPRQPGSTFKVLSTFLPALDTKGMTLATIQDDAPYSYPNGRPVSNWKSSYNGLTSIREAIYNSMNIVSVKTLNDVTPQVGYDYLLKLGFTTLVESRADEEGNIYSDINLPLALGGLTDGITNLEITAAYAAIANKGVYIKPIFYTKILDHDGKVLLSNEPTTRQVMKESTAWLLTNAMEDVIKKGTGTKIKFQTISMPISGKTGTTTNDNDIWFSGYTPYLTASVWAGYDNNGSLSNTSYHLDLWRKIMEQIHQDMEVVSFTMPDSIVSASVCSKCGKLAIDGVCNQALGGSTIKTEYFAKGTVPTEKCSCHVKLKICRVSGHLANEFCPAASIYDIVYLSKTITNGKDVTADADKLLPSNLENTSCRVHSKGIVEEEMEEEIEEEIEENEELTEGKQEYGIDSLLKPNRNPNSEDTGFLINEPEEIPLPETSEEAPASKPKPDITQPPIEELEVISEIPFEDGE